MEPSSHWKPPPAARFLSLLSDPEGGLDGGGGGGELEESEVFLIGAELASSEPPSPSMSGANALGSPSLSSPGGFRRTFPETSSGILAALPEDDKRRALRNPNFTQRKPVSVSSCSSGSSSPPVSALAIPGASKVRPNYSLSVPVDRVWQKTAAVNVPVGPRRVRMGVAECHVGSEVEEEEDEMVPPHVIVARASTKATASSSMLEGAGRTLKGRDLRRVRNAVLRQTGFLD